MQTEKSDDILRHLRAVIRTPAIRAAITRDMRWIWRNLGLTPMNAVAIDEPGVKSIRGDKPLTYRMTPANVTFTVLGAVDSARTLDDAESQVHDILQASQFVTGGTNRLRPTKRSLLDAVMTGLNNRAELIYRQIKPYLPTAQGKHEAYLDYGAGDCKLAATITGRDGLRVDACDVIDYPNRNGNVPFTLLTPSRVQLPQEKYTIGIVTNVLHHDADNESSLRLLTKLVSRKLIVIETVPEGKTRAEIEQDAERTFFFDWLYNGGMHPKAGIPVPATYETVRGWKERFAEHGWRCTKSLDLKRDQPLIPDRHVLFVFERSGR